MMLLDVMVGQAMAIPILHNLASSNEIFRHESLPIA